MNYDYKMNEEIRKELNIYNLNDIVDYRCNWTQCLLRMRDTHISQVSAHAHSSWQNKRRTTKRTMETTTHEDGTRLDGLYPVAGNNDKLHLVNVRT